MTVEEILINKRTEIRQKGIPEQIPFNREEINTLADTTALKIFKMKSTGYGKFEPSRNLLDCVRRICLDDNLYLVLEFCVRMNIALEMPVSNIMPKFEML